MNTITPTSRQDDRTPAQKKTHNWLVVGTDRVLSGWRCNGGAKSIAAWACEDHNLDRVFSWVHDRKDMKRVRIVDCRKRGYYPKNGWLHIYVVDETHPAVGGKKNP
jgi:hypothetical protein